MELPALEVGKAIRHRGLMAVGTILVGRRGRNMIARMTCDNYIVMTVLTAIGNSECHMVEITGCEGATTRWCMAGLAIDRRRIVRHMIG